MTGGANIGGAAMAGVSLAAVRGVGRLQGQGPDKQQAKAEDVQKGKPDGELQEKGNDRPHEPRPQELRPGEHPYEPQYEPRLDEGHPHEPLPDHEHPQPEFKEEDITPEEIDDFNRRYCIRGLRDLLHLSNAAHSVRSPKDWFILRMLLKLLGHK